VLFLRLCQSSINSSETLVGLYVGQDAVKVGAILLVIEVGPPVAGNLVFISLDLRLSFVACHKRVPEKRLVPLNEV
jgi:hypothetical protein